MNKKEAQKVFSEMVRDARQYIDGSNIDSVQINIHKVKVSNPPDGFKGDRTGTTNWFEKYYPDNDKDSYTRLILFPKRYT